MDSFLKMFNIQIVLMLYIICGFICRRLKIITADNQQQFIDFVLTILMPCMIFNSFRSVTLDTLRSAFFALCVSLGVCTISVLLGRVVYNRYPDDKKSVLRYATLISNSGFAGLPLAEEAFGSEGLLYASAFLIPLRVFMWSAGISMLSKENANKKQVVWKLLKNPCIIAVFLGLARGLFEINMPAFVDTAIVKIAACVSPMSMIIVGAIIADVDLRTIFEKGVLLYAGLRLALIPLAVLGILSLTGVNETVIGVSMMLTAMPAGTTTALLAAKYGANVEFASKLVFVTTVLSLITVPLLMFLL